MSKCYCLKCKFPISPSNLSRHFIKCDGNGTQRIKQKIKNEKIKISSKSGFKCHQCEKVFKTRQALGSHSWRHTLAGQTFRNNTSHIKRGVMNGWQNKSNEEILNIFSKRWKKYKIYCVFLCKDVYVQSKWELAYATYLNENNIRWENGKIIHYKLNGFCKKYFPDFYLIDVDEYVEVKGYYRDEAKQKMAAVISQNPNLKIKMLMEKDLLNLGINLRVWRNRNTQQT